MTDAPRFLLGYGERLTAGISRPASGPPPGPAYTFDEAVERLTPQTIETAVALDDLPDAACPDNEAVAVVTLHPQSLAKSYHPSKLLNQYNLRQVGSRPVDVLPEKWTKKKLPEHSPSTEMYVAGDRRNFERLASDFVENPQRIDQSIQRLEQISAPLLSTRLRHLDQAVLAPAGLMVELVLHAGANDDFILSALESYSEDLGVEAQISRRVFAGGLCFLPAVATREQLEALSQFAFLRVARPAARLRAGTPIERSSAAPTMPATPLPPEDALNPEIRVAVFDGGFISDSSLSPWVRELETPGIGKPSPDLVQHGHAVSSALLFGSLAPGTPPERPFTIVDNYRVLDDDAAKDPFDLYDVLQRVDGVLSENHYDFVNLSIGPYVAVEDDDIHPWTALLDTHLSTGRTLASIAVGNNGESPDALERRIQIPADCVNGLSLGAADSTKTGWNRAPYSAVGPGRAPGYIKPDLLDFGGTATEPFFVVDAANPGGVATTAGTSFASPSALRRAIGLRTHFGERLTPLGIKSLLIHGAEDRKFDRAEQGWGRVPQQVHDSMVCGDGQVRVIYQGTLDPGKYLRARIPLPPERLTGMVKIHATFVYATETDPEDPGNYSRAGLGVTFRPDDEKYAKDDAVDPKPRPFFKRTAFDSESELRQDAQMWETTLNAKQNMRGSGLHNPVFDVHYNARSNGGSADTPRAIPYALVVTVEALKEPSLYDRVVQTYAGQLEALVPVVELPIQV